MQPATLTATHAADLIGRWLLVAGDRESSTFFVTGGHDRHVDLGSDVVDRDPDAIEVHGMFAPERTEGERTISLTFTVGADMALASDTQVAEWLRAATDVRRYLTRSLFRRATTYLIGVLGLFTGLSYGLTGGGVAPLLWVPLGMTTFALIVYVLNARLRLGGVPVRSDGWAAAASSQQELNASAAHVVVGS